MVCIIIIMVEVRTAAQNALEFLKNNWKLLLALFIAFEIHKAWKYIMSTDFGKSMGKIAGDAATVATSLTGAAKWIAQHPWIWIGALILMAIPAPVYAWISKRAKPWINATENFLDKHSRKLLGKEPLDLEGREAEIMSRVADQVGKDAKAKAEGRQTLLEQQAAESRRIAIDIAGQRLEEKQKAAEEIEDKAEREAAEDAAEREYFDMLGEHAMPPSEPIA